MNWFERYGIVGNCVIVLAALYLLGLFPNFRLPDEKILIAGGAVSFLPLGYLFSLASQSLNLRYWRFNLGVVNFLRETADNPYPAIRMGSGGMAC